MGRRTLMKQSAWAVLIGHLVVGTSATVFGQCTTTFESAVTYPVGEEPSGVSSDDFNSDGSLDLVVANFSSNNVSVLLGNGDGTFQVAVQYPVGERPGSVVVGDFNRDGKLDLAVANGGTTAANGSVSILLGNGDGTFQSASNFAGPAYPQGTAAVDLDRDGILDLVVAGPASNELFYLRGSGSGSFSASGGNLFTLGHPVLVRIGDFNRDGKPDMVTPCYNDDSVSVLLSNGNGTAQAAVNFAAGSAPLDIGVSDFNRDGLLDLVVANQNSSNVSVLLGNGNGLFQGAVNHSVMPDSCAVATGDLGSV